MRETWAILPVDFGFDRSAIRGRDISAMDREGGRFRHAFQIPSAIGPTKSRAVHKGAATHCAISAWFAAKSWCWDDKIRAPAVFDRSLSRAHHRRAPIRHA